MMDIRPWLLLFVLFLAAAAPAQECLDYDGFPGDLTCEVAAPGGVADMARSGSALFGTNGTELAVYDLADAAHPVRVAALDLGGAASSPSASGDLLAVAVSGVGVLLYDVSAPATPVLAGTISAVAPSGFYQVGGLALRGDLLVYTEAMQPVRLMDVSDPAAPVQLATLETTVYSRAVIEGDLLALAGTEFALYDVSDPASPVLVDHEAYYYGCEWERCSVARPAILDGIAYAEVGYACNWRNPYLYGDPVVFSYWIEALGAAKHGVDGGTEPEKIIGLAATHRADIIGGYLAFEDVAGFHRLYVLDGLGGVAPAPFRFPLMSSYNCLVEIDGRVIAGTDEGVVVADVPGAELEAFYAGFVGSDVGSPQDMKVEGDLALFNVGTYLTVETGLNYYETFKINHVRVWRGDEYVGDIDFGDSMYCGLTWSRPFAFGDEVVTVWSNDCEDAISPVDVNDPAAMAHPAYIVLPDCRDAARVGDHLMLLDAVGGVRPVDMTDPSAPVVLDACLTGSRYDGFAVRGDRLYLRVGTTLRVADVGDPLAPTLLAGEYTVPAGGLKVVEDLLFVMAGTQLTWYALSGGDEPLAMGTADVGTAVRDVVFSGSLIYYADDFGIGLIGMGDAAPRGRLMAQKTAKLSIRGESLWAAQTTQNWPFTAPLDCADIVPVFVHSIEAVRDGGRAILGWSTSDAASADDFLVDLQAAEGKQRLPILSDGRGGFRSVANVAPQDEATFSLYLVEGGEPRLLQEQTLPPVALALRTELRGAYPNPFNPRTEIVFSLREAGEAELAVYDLSGRRVAVLVSGHQDAGEHAVPWLGCDETGRALASGSYLARLTTEEGVQSRKLLLLR